VLTIGKLGTSPNQLAYYEQQVAQGLEDYFSGRGEAPGRWVGAGCGGLGIRGQVNRESFIRAMDGCDPRTGERLKPVHGRTKVAAFDLTFSAPKSVSVLFAIADETVGAALLDAHEKAVDAALAYVEREACYTRRGRNGVLRVRGEGFVAAAYRHRLSRAGDPQLHTHAVVANMTRAEDRWTSLEGHALYEHKSAGGAVYRAVLRAEVRERLPWVWWRQVGRGLFEIDGVPAAVLREFSRRRVEIEERAMQLTGVAARQLSRERLQGIALATRKAKEYGVDGARWREEAKARAAEHGLRDRELRRLLGSEPRLPVVVEADVIRSAAARLSGPDGLTANHNTFARRHALAEFAGEFTQGAPLAQLERATTRYLDQRDVVALGRLNGEHRFTTRDLLACERTIIDTTARNASRQAGVLDANQLRWPAGLQLTDEQLAAVQAIATDGRGVSVLQALTGTGKTRVLAALATVYTAAGYRVIGVAPTGRAARELFDEAGIPALTIHRLVPELDECGGLAPKTVLLFDEAGTAPTRPSAALLAHADRAGAKVIAAGDSGQLPSVAAGGWFAVVAEMLAGPELRQVMRQRDQAERDALDALHDGDPDRYLELKAERGALTVHEHEREALARALADWDAARQAHGLAQAVMIARDNATRALLNRCARDLLIRDRTLGHHVFSAGDREFSIGDRVIARRNVRHHDIDNGTLGRITDVDRRTRAITITTYTGHERTLDADYIAKHLEHAYALTAHGAQGATFEWAGVLGRASEFTREWAYTALTRARDSTQVYLIAAATAGQLEREQYAPGEAVRTPSETLQAMTRSLTRREAEAIAAKRANASSAADRAPAQPEQPTPPTVAPQEPDWHQIRDQRTGARGRER
jgi:conjugative relaxase-like TrwC/TraI family protein